MRDASTIRKFVAKNIYVENDKRNLAHESHESTHIRAPGIAAHFAN